MRTLKKALIIPALLLLAPLAGASTYTGTWNNKTFNTEGALTIEFEVGKDNVAGSFDFDGPVFGAGDPPAIPFSAPLDSDGSGSFTVIGTGVGDLSGSFSKDGKLDITISNIPGGVLTEARINGKFDLKVEKFDATYEIDSSGALFANGVAEAHVPKKPKLKLPKRVKFSGAKGKAKLTVKTNTGISKVKAKATGKAKVRVTGKNPYKIVVKKTTRKTTRVKIIVVNEDGFKTTKTVKFIKKG